jgi:predicted ATPase
VLGVINHGIEVPRLAGVYAKLGLFDDAWRCIRDALTAVETTKERWCEAEVHRIAAEIALMSAQSDRAEADFKRALSVARAQQARSWELRTSISLARLWRDPGQGAASVRTACSGLRLVY